MALDATDTQTVYEACGLLADGNTYTLVRFNSFSVTDINTATFQVDYSTAKGYIDTNIAALSTGAEAAVEGYCATYQDTATSSFKMRGEVVLDDSVEKSLAKNAIIDVIGVLVEAVDSIKRAQEAMNAGGIQGSVERG